MVNAVSLFSGCGGFCEGVERAGFDVRVSVELDRFAAETYMHNFPDVPLIHGDVAEFLRDDIEGQSARYGLDDVDMVFGGPPCQGYSQIGTRDLSDKRNDLYQEFARIVDTLRPKLFLMENVPNLVSLNKGHYKVLVLDKFRAIGYSNVTIVRVTASDHGVPQERRRVVFIGSRDEDGFGFDLQQYCEQTLEHIACNKSVTVWDAIGDLPKMPVESGKTIGYPKQELATDYQKLMRLDFDYGIYDRCAMRKRGIGAEPVKLHNHHTKEIQERRKKLISMLAPGKKANTLPVHVWNGKRPEKWRRLHPDHPSHTILAHMHRDLSEWVHPKLDRWITVREAARLQSFHDGFVFKSSEWQQLKQIGNAVPPLLALALGQMAQRVLAELADRKGVNDCSNSVQRDQFVGDHMREAV